MTIYLKRGPFEKVLEFIRCTKNCSHFLYFMRILFTNWWDLKMILLQMLDCAFNFPKLIMKSREPCKFYGVVNLRVRTWRGC